MNKFIFEGFEPANTTPVPDVLFDELLSVLSGAELKVMLYIIRRTLGFKKTTDAISLTQFEKGIITKDGKVLDKGCNLSRETICKALFSLEKRGCIKSEKRSNSRHEKEINVYSIRFRGDQKVVGKSDYLLVGKSDYVVKQSDQGSQKSSTRVVGKSDIQETVLQDTDLQETVCGESPTSETPAHEDTHPSFSNSSSQQKDKSQVNSSKKARWEILLDYWDSKYGPGPRSKWVENEAKDMIERMKPTPEQVDKVCAELKARKKPITFESMYNNWHLLKEVEEREKAQTQPQPPGPIGVSGLPRIVTSSARPQVIPPVRRAERNR